MFSGDILSVKNVLDLDNTCTHVQNYTVNIEYFFQEMSV